MAWGGSLINAGVAAPADELTLADTAWPAPWRANRVLWSTLYARAAEAVGARSWPRDGERREAEEGKLEAMQALAAKLGPDSIVAPADLTIEPPSDGDPTSCQRCGNCFSGCNVGAKKTLGQTQLAQAQADGVEVYTGATVVRIARGTGDYPWEVHWAFTDGKKVPDRRKPYKLIARRVVLAAGSLGSTEILLRSRGPGICFSSELGKNFSTNGDVVGAQANLETVVAGVGNAAAKNAKPGPGCSKSSSPA
jgi:cholesterol oxidase